MLVDKAHLAAAEYGQLFFREAPQADPIHRNLPFIRHIQAADHV